jgi:hypothetical protein
MGLRTTHGFAAYQRVKNGTASAESLDPDNIQYAFLDPEHVADAILGVIDQPWGVVISDVTVRASGDYYIV